MKLSFLFLFSILITSCSNKAISTPSELLSFHSEVKINKIWRKNLGYPPGSIYIFNAPLIIDNYIYYATYNGFVYKLDLTGKIIWRIKLKQNISAKVNVQDSYVLIGTNQGNVYILDKETGKIYNKIYVARNIYSQPILNNDKVIINLSDDRVVAYDINSGEEFWSFNDINSFNLTTLGNSTPLLVDKLVFVGLSDGRVVSLNFANGFKTWELNLASNKGYTEIDKLADVDATPEIDGSDIYFISLNGSLIKINLMQAGVQWQANIKAYTQPYIGYDSIVVTETDGSIVKIDKQTGQIIWQVKDYLYRDLTNPVIVNNYVVFADLSGYIHVLDLISGETVGRSRLSVTKIQQNITIDDDRNIYLTDRLGFFWKIEVKEK